MTVAEMIEALSTMPAELDVVVPTDEHHEPVPVMGIALPLPGSPVHVVLDMEAW